MITNKDIICLSTIDWNFVRQRHQIFMQMFAQHQNRVIFVEHLGFSRQKIRDVPKISRRLLKALKQRSGIIRHGPENLKVITPLVLPPVNTSYNFLNNKIFLKVLQKRIQRLCPKKSIIWTYLATTTALNLIKKLSPELVIYDCVYDAIRHPHAPKEIANTEIKLLKTADIVFTDTEYFYNLKNEYNPQIFRIPPGVDFEHFNAPCSGNKNILSAMRQIKGPRICSFSSIDSMRIDLNLIDFIARQKPEWSIIMIGPVVDMKIPHSLLSRENIIWLGTKSYRELPLYLKECDILILPYKLNEFTQSILPAKIFECLATGKPTISTALPELANFKKLINIAADAPGFIEAIEQAYLNDSVENKKNRILFAKNNSWQSRFKIICERMEMILNTREER